MTDHWQTIEGCVEGEISKLMTESTWWEEGSGMQKRILADLKEHEDALAFVREMRQGQGMPEDVLASLRVVMEFVDGYVGECLAPNDVELATYAVNEWLDTHSAGAEE